MDSNFGEDWKDCAVEGHAWCNGALQTKAQEEEIALHTNQERLKLAAELRKQEFELHIKNLRDDFCKEENRREEDRKCQLFHELCV